MAQNFDEGSSRQHHYDCLRSSGMAHMSTALVRLQIASLNDLVLRKDEVVQAGTHEWQIDRALTCELAIGRSSAEAAHHRADLPVHRTQVGRASLTTALMAGHPNNRRESLRLFEQDILAPSTNPTQDSRIRTYRAICRAWDVQPFPLSLEAIRCFGASLKAGGYRSASLYYQAVLGYQARHLQVMVEPILRHAIRDAVRSIRRGLGPAGLKDSFNALDLNNLQPDDTVGPFDIANPIHMLDVVILGLWYMLRESELASARLAHLSIDASNIGLLVPIHKTDQTGSLTIRHLNCACRYRRHQLCPWHAGHRHARRVRLHSAHVDGPSFPLVPDGEGRTPSKYMMIQHIRAVLQEANIPTTRADEQGAQLQRFGGHVLRVSGAQMMGAGGVPIQLIQLLGRWSSQAVQRYVQTSHMSVVPAIPAQLLGQEQPQLLPDTGTPLTTRQQDQPAPLQVEQPVARPSMDGRESQQLTRNTHRIQQLGRELASLRLAIAPPEETFVLRNRSLIAHRGFQYENQNHPDRWKTPCGWRYGLSKFFRVPHLAAEHSRCKKCFDLPGQDASDSEDIQSDGQESTSSSESTHPDRDNRTAGEKGNKPDDQMSVASFSFYH